MKKLLEFGLEELYFTKKYSSSDKVYYITAKYSYITHNLRVVMDGNTQITYKEWCFTVEWAENIVKELKEEGFLSFEDYLKVISQMVFLKRRKNRYTDVNIEDIKF